MCAYNLLIKAPTTRFPSACILLIQALRQESPLRETYLSKRGGRSFLLRKSASDCPRKKSSDRVHASMYVSLRPRRYGTTGTHRGSRQASPARKQRGLPLRLGCFASSWIAAVVKHKNKPHHERARVGLIYYACLVAYAPIFTVTSTSFLEASNGITVVPVSVCPSTTSSFTPFSILSGFSTLIL